MSALRYIGRAYSPLTTDSHAPSVVGAFHGDVTHARAVEDTTIAETFVSAAPESDLKTHLYVVAASNPKPFTVTVSPPAAEATDGVVSFQTE
jgi:hypothetical protein